MRGTLFHYLGEIVSNFVDQNHKPSTTLRLWRTDNKQ